MTRNLRQELEERKRQRKRMRRLRIMESEYEYFDAKKIGTNRFVVINYLKCTQYEVDLDEMNCNCPDAQFSMTHETQVYCKHVLFVMLARGGFEDALNQTKQRKRNSR